MRQGRCTMRRRAAERGFVLLSVVLGITIIALVAFMLSNQSATQVAIAAGELQRDELRYVTEAGLAHARWQLVQNASCSSYGNLANTTFGSHTYSATVSPNSGSPVSMTVTATLASGESQSRVDSVRAFAAPQSTVFQPGSGGEDTYIWDGAHKDTNFGATAYMELNNASAERVILMRFDLSGVPAGANIMSATLQLWLEGGSALSNGVVDAHRVTQAWYEGEEDDNPPSAPGATYMDFDGTNPWVSPGGDYDPTPVDTITIPNLTPAWHQWDVSALVTGESPRVLETDGALLRVSGGNVDKVKFTSSDGNSTQRPTLTVTFTCECGASCAVTGATLPFAHWKLDETSGETAVDSAGGNDGTLKNGPQWVAGQLDGGLSFDGSNDYIVANSLNPHAYDDFTVSAWYKSASNGVSDDEYIFEHNDNWVDEVSFGPTDDGTDDRLRFGFASGGSGFWDPHYGTSDVVDQQWHHLVGVRASGRIKIYVDGVEETDEADAHAGDTIIIDGDGPFIGDLPGSTEQVDGFLDDVRLYDRALTSLEIFELFAAGSDDPTNAPVAHWKMDDAGGFTAIDSVGAHDGTLTNGPVWATGPLGGALVFDGLDDYVEAGSFDIVGDGLSMTAWFNADNVATEARIISKAFGIQAAEAWWQLSMIGSGSSHHIRMRIKAGGSTTTFADSTVDLQVGQWYFAVATYDNASAEMKLYLDGAEVASRIHSTGGALDTDSSVPVWMGANGDPTRFLDGSLDDVRLYDRALTESEVGGLFAEGGGGGAGGSVSFIVANKNDDAEQLIKDGTMYLDSTDLELSDNLAATAQPTDIVGIRFSNVSLVQGAVITNAFVQFQVDELDSGVASLELHGEAVDNAATFTSSSNNITSRTLTSASVPWLPPVWSTVGERGTDQQTTNLAPVIQEIVNRPGWSSGNAIALIISGTGVRTAEAVEGDPAGAPELNIAYGSSCSIDIADDFETQDYGGNIGTESWSGDWFEPGEGNGPDSGDEQVVSYGGSFVGRLRDNNNGGEGLAREVDLSKYTQAMLTLKYWRVSLDDANDFATLAASDDGGSSWVEINRLEGPANDASDSPLVVSHDISNFLSANTQIRLLTSSTMGNTDTIYIDDVQIAACE